MAGWLGGWSDNWPVEDGDDINDAALWYEIDTAINEKQLPLGGLYWPRTNAVWGEGGGSIVVTQTYLKDTSRTPNIGPDPDHAGETKNLNSNSWTPNMFAGRSPSGGDPGPSYPRAFDIILGADLYDQRWKIRHVQVASNTEDTIFFNGNQNFTADELSVFASHRYAIIKRGGLWWEQRRLHWGHSPSFGAGNSQLLRPPRNLSVSTSGTSGSTTYNYVVTSACDNAESDVSSTATTTSGNATLSDTNNNSIIWEGLDVAETYNIYRQISGTYKLVGSTTGTSFTDDGSVTPGVAPPSVSTWTLRDLNINKRPWNHNEFVGLTVAYQSDPFPPMAYATISSNGSDSVSFSNSSQKPNEGTRYEVLVAGGWTDFTSADPLTEWYRGVKKEYFSHSTNDALNGTGKPADTVSVPTCGPDGLEFEDVPAFDIDVWTPVDLECGGPDENFSPDLFKTIRGRQLAIEGTATAYVPKNDIEGDGYEAKKTINRPFTFPTLMYKAGVNSFKPSASSFASTNGAATLVLTLPTIPYVGVTLYYTIYNWKGESIEDTSFTLSDLSTSHTVSTGISLKQFNEGITIYGTWGWTRKVERSFRHMWRHTYFIPDEETDDFGNVIVYDPPDADHPGTWNDDSPSTCYVDPDSMGFVEDGSEAYITNVNARYQGDNFNDSTTRVPYPDGWDPVLNYQMLGADEVISADARINHYPPAVFVATGGTTTTFLTSGLQDVGHIRNRWDGRTGRITHASGGGTTDVVITATSDDGTTLTFASIGTAVASGDTISISEPLQGSVWQWDGTKWVIPTGKTKADQRRITGQIVVRYGRYMVGDVVGAWLLNEMYHVLNVLRWTYQGYSWTGTGADGSQPYTKNSVGGPSVFGNEFDTYKDLVVANYASGAGLTTGGYTPSSFYESQNPVGDASENYQLTATKAWGTLTKFNLLEAKTDWYVFGFLADEYPGDETVAFYLDGDPFNAYEDKSVSDPVHLNDPDWSQTITFSGGSDIVATDPVVQNQTTANTSYDASAGKYKNVMHVEYTNDGGDPSDYTNEINYDDNGTGALYRKWHQWTTSGPDSTATIWTGDMFGTLDAPDQKDPATTDIAEFSWFAFRGGVGLEIGVFAASIEIGYSVQAGAILEWDGEGGLTYLD